MDLLKWSQVKLSFEIGGDWDLRVVDSSSMLQLGPEKKTWFVAYEYFTLKMFRKVIQRFVGFIESWCKLIYFIGSSYIFFQLLDCKVHIFSEGLNFIWQSNYLVFLQKFLILSTTKFKLLRTIKNRYQIKIYYPILILSK